MSDMYFESPMAKFEDNCTWIHDALWGTSNTYALQLMNLSITSRIQVQLSSNLLDSQSTCQTQIAHISEERSILNIQHILKTHYLQDSAINFVHCPLRITNFLLRCELFLSDMYFESPTKFEDNWTWICDVIDEFTSCNTYVFEVPHKAS